MGATTEWVPPGTERVERNTAEEVKERLHREMEQRLERYRTAGPDAIDARLQELDREWDIERVLQANMGVVLLASLTLGFRVNPKWFAFSGVVAAFFLQHAVQGWCPPVVPWRHAGIRTMQEIEAERIALKALRGDFHPTTDPNEALRQASA